jgi:acetate kinase
MTTGICHGDAVFCEVGTELIKILLRKTSGIKGITTTNNKCRTSERKFHQDVTLMKVNAWLHVTSHAAINCCE